MYIGGQAVGDLIVEQVAAFLTDPDELMNVAKLVINGSRQEFSSASRNETLRATSRVSVFPGDMGTGPWFRGVRVPVIGQFCVRDTEASEGGMVSLGGEFLV
jgi:hypothetical protein